MSDTARKADAIVAPVWKAGPHASGKAVAAAAVQIGALVPHDSADRHAVEEALEFLGMHPAAVAT